MLEKTTLIKIKNATNSRVGYLIPDMGNFHRSFMPGETKEVPFEEVQKLVFTPGGETLLKQHLTIENKEALDSILGEVEPEYFYTEKDVKKLLESGTIEQFMDFLDFAPDGMINLAKDLAVSMETNDIRKRDAIKEKTGFDVTQAIKINHQTEEVDSTKVETKTRRTNPISVSSTERRATPPKYNVVSTK